ncbi:MAG: FAD-binding protein, partial [Actinomycetota bacterium]|nr:FAD-binding protein [Actinomycetota bacterium]
MATGDDAATGASRPAVGRARPAGGDATPLPLRSDIAVIGAGAAGLYAALIAAREGARVVLVSATP